METVGAMLSEGEWNTFNGICTEEADFMAQLLGNEIMPSNFHNAVSSTTFWPAHQNNLDVVAAGYVDENSSMYSSDDTNATSTVYSFSQGSCNYSEGSSVLFPPSGHERYYPNVISHQFMDYCMMTENKNDNVAAANNVIQGNDFLKQDVSNDSIESNDQKQPCEDDKPAGKEMEEPLISETLKEDNLSSPSEISKKRPRVPAEVQRSKKSMKLKKCSKVDHDDNDEDNNKSKNVIHVGQRPSASSCCSEDEYPDEMMNESSSGALNSSGKRRAGRGSATDPQSLYARKRRERINERLKILQSLVPNGTKVDISTMLEEAVQYVKFLQLQIKLLSSDDLWMYSPIAYNGMDIGLDWKTISTPKS